MHYTLCDMFSDLTQNAVEAGSSVITVVLKETDRDISLVIEDNGKGMTPEQLKRATDPFYTDGIKHPGRKVGLGIPFLIQTADMCGGSWNIRSDKGSDGNPPGTTVTCCFDLTNIDTPPVGDVTGYFRQILTFDGRYEMIITRIFSGSRRTRESAQSDVNKNSHEEQSSLDYTVRRSELLEALGLQEDGAFSDANSLALVGQYLESMEE